MPTDTWNVGLSGETGSDRLIAESADDLAERVNEQADREEHDRWSA
jgi:hypothetical protein